MSEVENNDSPIEMTESEMYKIAAMLKTNYLQPSFNLRVWVGLNRGKDDFQTFYSKVMRVIRECPAINDMQRSFFMTTAFKSVAEARESAAKAPVQTFKVDSKVIHEDRRRRFNRFAQSKMSVQEFCESEKMDQNYLRGLVNEFADDPKVMWKDRYEYADRSRTYTDEVLEELYKKFAASDLALSAFCKAEKVTYLILRDYIARVHPKEYEDYKSGSSMTSATNYESYFQIWKYSGKSLSLFCKEQNIVYISFRDYIIENHVDEYNAYNAERIARNTLSEDEEQRCGVAYGIKNDYPERSIKECCEEAGIDRQKFDAWLKRSGKSVKPACIARSEGMYEDLMDPNNKLSVSALLQKHRLTKKKFLEWADIEGVMLPKGLRQTSVIEDQMEAKYKKFVASGKSIDDFCKEEKVNKALLSAYIDKYHPEEETDETTTTEAPAAWEKPVPKTPIIKAVAEEAELEVVEKPSEVPMSNHHDDKVEDIKKKLLDAIDELGNLCAPEPEKVSNNMKELTALVAASGGIKNEDVFVISGTFVKELMNMDRNFKELQSFKDNLKNMLR